MSTCIVQGKIKSWKQHSPILINNIRTTAEANLNFGHEITGEVVSVGSGVEFVKVGDICSIPFNIACGKCRNCEAGHTGVCLRVNPARPGSAYGYVDMGNFCIRLNLRTS